MTDSNKPDYLTEKGRKVIKDLVEKECEDCDSISCPNKDSNTEKLPNITDSDIKLAIDLAIYCDNYTKNALCEQRKQIREWLRNKLRHIRGTLQEKEDFLKEFDEWSETQQK